MIKHSFLALIFLSGMQTGLYAQLCPAYSLGPDTVIDCGANVTLQAPAGWGNYFWSNGANTSSITTSTPGNYWCRSVDTLSNVVVNSDFSAGSTGFMSDYIPGTGGPWGLLSNPGEYAVTTNSNLVHMNFPVCFDHTTNNGTNPMLVVNGASVAGQRVWYQTVAVNPNTNYIFSVWFTSVDPGSPAILQFSVNAVNLGTPFSLSPATCFWQNFSTTWNSGVNTSVTISIRNQNFAGGGNDFAIDDITFAPICVKRDTVNVSHPPTPVLSMTGGDTICPGDSLLLTALGSVAGSDIQWIPGGQTDTNLWVSPLTDTWYTARAGYRNCWSNPDSVKVILADSLTASLTGLPAICPGFSTPINATVNGGWGTVTSQWQPGNIYGTTLNVSPAATTTYTFTVTDRCTADTLTHVLTVHPEPNPVIMVADNQQCMPLCTSFGINANTNLQNITWNFGDGNGGTGTAPQHCYTAGLYNVSAVVEDINGCFDSITVPAMVEVFPLPIAGFFPDPPYITSLDPVVNFTNTSTGANTFAWSFGDGEYGGDENPEHTYVPAWILDDHVSVQLIAMNMYGCADTVQQILNVQNLTTFYVPNAFSPNGDGINDIFLPVGKGVSRIKTYIFDRWGEMIFGTEALAPAWNGTHQRSGDACPMGVYVYDINYVDTYGKEYHLTGHISLLR